MDASKNNYRTTPVLKAGTLVRPDLFIISARNDGILFLLTPFIAMAVFLVGMLIGLTEQAAFVAATVGAAGHHLPGMMRAYGDKDLFKNFKSRFIAAPVLLSGLCVAAMYFNFGAVNIVLLAWGFWHGLAQLYGFARIYDRKAGVVDGSQGRLDLVLLILWFQVGIVNSDNRMFEFIGLAVDCGFPTVTAAQLSMTAFLCTSGAVVYTGYYLFLLFRKHRRGDAISVNKLVLISVSLIYWNLVMIAVPITIVSIALFELFHDAQYLGIVWSFNKNRQQKQQLASGFEQKVFANGTMGLGIYLSAILIYGLAAMVQYEYPSTVLRDAAIVFFTVSTLLHFYFDGFIWKLRDPNIGVSLRLSAAVNPPIKSRPPAVVHGFKWVVFTAAIAGIAILQHSDSRSPIDKSEAILNVFPVHQQARNDLSEAYKTSARAAEAAGQKEAAVVWYRKAINTLPSDRDTQSALLRLSSDTPINFLD